MPIFKIDELVFVHSIKIPVAYCIYEPKRPAIINQLMGELEAAGIYQSGRYGKWEYAGMQDAIMDGKVMSEKLKSL